MKILILIMITSLFSLSAQADAKFDQLKNQFDQADSNSITKEDLLGAYLGRCFDPNDTLNGMILSTIVSGKSTGDSREGPQFPVKTNVAWQTALIQYGTPEGDLPPESNDNTPEKDIQEFWRLPLTSLLGKWTPVDVNEIVMGAHEIVASSYSFILNMDPNNLRRYSSTSTETIRKGLDGYLYVHNVDVAKVSHPTQIKTSEEYCYFFKKLY